jgi:hypothetical protein
MTLRRQDFDDQCGTFRLSGGKIGPNRALQATATRFSHELRRLIFFAAMR